MISEAHINKVHHKDWMQNGLPDKSVQLIIADPPYFEVKGDFDFVWASFDDYLKDVERWAIECKRLLADNGTLFWYGSSRRIAYTQTILDKYFGLLNNLVWNKGAFMGLDKSGELRSFAPCTERILMYSNDVYNLTQCVYSIRDYIRSEIKSSKGEIVFKAINGALGTATNGGGVASACLSLDKSEPAMLTKEMYIKLRAWLNSDGGDYLRKEYEELRRPFNNSLELQEVLNFSNEQSKVGAKYEHDTVKPETLTRALILTCSRPDDIVLVPFAGSGTECAMAAKEGRRYIGYDITERYVKMANDRCNNIKIQPDIFASLGANEFHPVRKSINHNLK